MKILKGKQGKSVAALLDRSEDRVKLLRAGFSGKEIEALYSSASGSRPCAVGLSGRVLRAIAENYTRGRANGPYLAGPASGSNTERSLISPISSIV